MVAKKLDLLAIIGPTASGKTKLAIDIAKKYNGEIIAADSRTIYKHLDIGTAKPDEKEQDGIVHWGLNLVGLDKNLQFPTIRYMPILQSDQLKTEINYRL